jgi:uncharacterized DUF497 family protein
MFSWDADKARKNYEKHDVPFEEAGEVFSDPKALDWEDLAHSEREPRSKRLGSSAGGRVLLIVYTRRRLENGTETIRIISARQATRNERKIFAGQ